MGFPIQRDGSSTVIPGLHLMGVQFQRKRSSSTLFGVGEDAGLLGERMAGARRPASAGAAAGRRSGRTHRGALPSEAVITRDAETATLETCRPHGLVAGPA